MAEEWVKNSRDETRAAYDARETVEAHLNALKDTQKQMADQVKKALQDKASAEAGLKTTEKQAETLRSELHLCEINLETERQLVKELREELRKAREAAQLLKEAAEAEKQASYALGVQETQSRLTEEFSAVARDYCDSTWEKALNATGVPADSSLRRPESVYYDPDIQVLPGSDSPPQSNQPQYLKSLQQIKLFLLLWKSQQIPTKLMVKGRKLRPPRVRAIIKIRIRARFQILPLLSPNE